MRFDSGIVQKLLDLCSKNGIRHCRDVFTFYSSDAASVLQSGRNLKTALICYSNDASHAYERTNLESLLATARLVLLYTTAGDGHDLREMDRS